MIPGLRGREMNELPKLYRTVFLTWEIIVDSIRGGEHHQEGWNEYYAARLVIVNGEKAWQLLHPELMEDEEFDPLYMGIDWVSVAPWAKG